MHSNLDFAIPIENCSRIPVPASQPLEIRAPLESEFAEWDRFASNHPHGSPFHLAAWRRTIEESFAYEPKYLLARSQGAVRGILPLFFVKNPVIGRALISSPFAVYGGILADCEHARNELYRAALALGRSLRVGYVEFRNRFPEQCVGVPNVSRYVGFTKSLQPDDAGILASLPKKTRNVVRKSLNQQFTARHDVRSPETFDSIHARSMKRLGTPNFPIKYFRKLLAYFGPMVDVREVWLGNDPVAVSLNFYFRGEMHIYYAATDARFNHLAPNTFMYFDHLRWAGGHDFHTFDFGRCKRGTGVFEFKAHWGTVMSELPYEIALIERKTLPNFSPANPRFDLPIRIWRALPSSITRALSRYLLPMFP
jgi:FemAB-related protein (PEP-CTERM system-associated)